MNVKDMFKGLFRLKAILLAVIGLTILVGVAVLIFSLAGCASMRPTTPYTTESVVGNLHKHWASDWHAGGDKVLWLHNPTSQNVDVLVVCYAFAFESEPEKWFYNVPPGGDPVAMFNVPGQYLVGDACFVEEWRPSVQ